MITEIHIHTVVFMLDRVNIPLERKLFPESARILKIFYNPEKYGWRPTEHTDHICRINMREMGISPNTILEFVRIIRNGVIGDISEFLLRKIEHFAILIGAGADDMCPFRKVLDNYRENIKLKLNKYRKLIEKNPMTPEQDIYQYYNWMVRPTCHSAAAIADGWSLTIPLPDNKHSYYFRKLKDSDEE